MDLDEYGDEQADLSNSKIERWLDDVVGAIQDKFSDELSSSIIENEVQDICEDVVNVFDDAGVSLKEVRAYFYNSDSSLIDSFSYDVDAETLD